MEKDLLRGGESSSRYCTKMFGVVMLCVICAFVNVTDAQKEPTDIITDPPIILQPNNTQPSLPQVPPSPSEGGSQGQEGAEGQEGGGQGEGQGQEGAEGQEEAEGQGDDVHEGAEGQEGTEAPEGPEEAEGGEAAEGPENPELEGLEDRIENEVDMYLRQGMTASLEALHTMYPGINITDIIMEKSEVGDQEIEGGEHELQGSEGTVSGRAPYGVHPYHLQSLASDAYGDYEVDFFGQPKASYRYVPGGSGRDPQPRPVPPVTGINPTPVVKPLPADMAATEGGQARLYDTGGSPAQAFRPDGVVRHPEGMTPSATFGIVVGTILLSWLILGPGLCLAWRWREKRQEKRRILLQRAQVHGSVDEGIMDVMVMSELGKAGRRDGVSSPRRQRGEDVEEALTRNRSELQSFPTTTTLESRVI